MTSVDTLTTPTATRARTVDVLVMGAGFAGLCAAIKLDEDGERDVVVVDKGPDVGGTWRDNTYPGAACDVPSQLYSYSFAPNRDWAMSFSPQSDIQDYLRRVVRDSGVGDRFVFDTTVQDATWDEQAQRWTVRTTGPTGEQTYAARVLVSATGALSEPRLPDIEGIGDFGGDLFHTAQWNHEVDLAGKRVAVIGTGASAIQVVPHVAETAGHLDVYQRTAPYVIPRHDRRYSRLERFALRHVPGLQRLYRTAIYWGREAYVPAFTRLPRLAWPAKKMALANLAKGVRDPELRERLTPDFQIGCKRVLISNTYYPALDRDDVDVVTDRIERVTETGIVTADGTERPIDALVVATGFFTTDLPMAAHLTGRDGETLEGRWARTGMSAYKGTAIAGFPNLFFLVGPNTGLGHSSMVLMIESQVAYLRSVLRTMREGRHAEVEVDGEAEHRWSAGLQRRMRRTVWSTGGCASWYLDEHGNNTTLWPGSTFAFRARTAAFDAEAYRLTAPRRTTGATPDAQDPHDPQDPQDPQTETEKVPA